MIKELKEWFFAILFAVVLFFVLQTYVMASFHVKGHSMDYTFADGDRVIVSKLSQTFHTIKHGDIVVFKHDEHNDYIKRVIGMPGDTVEYKNDVLYINGKAIDEPYLKETKEKNKEGQWLTDDFNLETLLKTKVVPENTYFVMGDNRQHSSDSRRLGFIKQNKVYGKVAIRYWPLSNLSIDFSGK